MEFKIDDTRIYAENKGKLVAEITFPETSENVYSITHTFVDESLRGQGIAGKLVKTALDEIEKRNGKAVAVCSYAQKYFEKNNIQ